jgi:hypothetical protein
MHMMLRRAGRRGVEFDSVMVRIEDRLPVKIAVRTFDPAQQLLTVCGWCKRVDVHGRWQEIEAAIESLVVFAAEAVPAVTHGICLDCEARMVAEIGGG